MRDDYRQGRRANCIQGRRSRMDAPNNTLPQRHSRRSCFVISAFGGNDEQLSEAGIQLKYASGVAGHYRGGVAK